VSLSLGYDLRIFISQSDRYGRDIILIAKTLIALGKKTKMYVVYTFNMDLGGIHNELI
jgi:hypothetical protein